MTSLARWCPRPRRHSPTETLPSLKTSFRQDVVVNRLNREVFSRAVEIGDDFELREWAMFMVLVARCLERVGDNAVQVAEQTEFVVTGLLPEPTNASEPTV